MSGVLRRLSYAALFGAVMFAASGCSLQRGDTDGSGMVLLGSESYAVTSVAPPLDMIPDRYHISGSGPSGKTFSVTSVEFPTTVPDLAVGEWTIRVVATNADGQEIAEGETSINVVEGSSVATSLPVHPIEGQGLVHVSANWIAQYTGNPSISAQLSDESGNSIAIPVDVESPGLAAGTSELVQTGFYTLEVKLLDGGNEVMGAIESVQVTADVTTPAEFSFDNINRHATRIEKFGEQFVVEWDPPVDSGSITAYNVYSRPRTGGDWQLMSQVSAGPAPSIEITSAILAYGVYELAVQSVYATGGVSGLHTSLDESADPATGWYVDWQVNP